MLTSGSSTRVRCSPGPCFSAAAGWFLAVAASAALLLAAAPAPAHARVCDRIAAKHWKTNGPRKLIRRLRRGQVGCFHAAVYKRRQLVIRKPGITLRSVPGERATWEGRIVIKAPRVTLERLNLDGTRGPRCPRSLCYAGEDVLPSPTVNGPHARLIEDDITNRRGICLNLTHYYGRSPRGFRVVRNRIHDCRPADNHVHGVYIVSGRHGLVRGNVIYANGDKGIVLYPNARNETIEQNTIDGNRTGVHFGGGTRRASSGNVVTRNVISFPRPRDGWPARFNVEYYWPGPAGRGNVVRDNCMFTDARDAYFSGDPPGSGVIPRPRGVSVSDSVVADPDYVDRDRADYRLVDGSPCAGLGAPPAIASADAWCDQVDPPGARRAAYEALWHAPRRSCFGPRP